MAQDIRNMLKEQNLPSGERMPDGHRGQFRELLDKEFPDESKSVTVFWLRIAAGFILVLAAGIFVYFQQAGSFSQPQQNVVETTADDAGKAEKVREITLGDLSPDLSKIENYYLANINMELASLELTGESEQLIKGYMSRLTELNDEYMALINELNTIGPNQETVNALIENLQLRLDLLYRLKDQLKELKQEENETISTQEI